MRIRRFVLLAGLLPALPALAQEGRDENRPDGWSRCGGRPCLSLDDGNFTLTPQTRIDADSGSFFGQDRPDGFRSGVNLRRARLTAEGTVAEDFGYRFTWEFGGPDPRDYSAPYEAQFSWRGLGWGTVRAGAFSTAHLPEYAGSSFDLLFLERAAVSNVAASVASGDSRIGIGLEGSGERWVGAATLTAGTLDGRGDDRRRGVAARGAVLALDGAVQLQLGLNFAWQGRPTAGKRGRRIGFADDPELRVDSRRFLDTGDIDASSAHAWGPELMGRIGPVYVEAVYQRIGTEGGARGHGFQGWYAQAALPLLGEPRRRDAEAGTWRNPRSREGFAPRHGQFGALEMAGRRSVVDLRDAGVRGGRQSVWTVGLNWYPVTTLRLAAQYENGRIDLDRGDRPFQAVGLRASLNL